MSKYANIINDIENICYELETAEKEIKRLKSINASLVCAISDLIDDIEKGRTEWETNGSLYCAKQALSRAKEK